MINRQSAIISSLIGFLWIIACGTELPETPYAIEDTGHIIYGEGKGDEARGIYHPPLPDDAHLDGPLQVLFAPTDPVMNAELALIEEVIEARKADHREFSRDANPYRIHYAVYNLRSPDVINSLVRARNVGVVVRILVDAEQIDPVNRPWNTAYEYLAGQGFRVEKDNRVLNDAQKREADVIGIVMDGHMHLKLRVFETPDTRRVLTGSANPGDNVSASDDALHIISDPELSAFYARAWTSVLFDVPLRNNWNDNEPVNVLFTAAEGEGPGARILRWLSEEREQILIKVFSLRDFGSPDFSESLVQVLSRKVAEGVPVYVITDRKQSDGVDERGRQVNRDDPTEDRLRRAGVKVYEALNTVTSFTAMHHKAAVLGRTDIRVITGSANWSVSGLGSSRSTPRNIEDVLFIDSTKFDGGYIGRRYIGNWIQVLNRYGYQSVRIDGEAPSDEVFEFLSNLSGWPQKETGFIATAEIERHERIYVEGDPEELGEWGRLHEGLRLTTSADDYPEWWSNTSITLPIGTVFDWRLKAALTDGTQGRPESRKTRSSFVSSDPFFPGMIAFHAQWGIITE